MAITKINVNNEEFELGGGSVAKTIEINGEWYSEVENVLLFSVKNIDIDYFKGVKLEFYQNNELFKEMTLNAIHVINVDRSWVYIAYVFYDHKTGRYENYDDVEDLFTLVCVNSLSKHTIGYEQEWFEIAITKEYTETENYKLKLFYEEVNDLSLGSALEF